jgi:hypothetical protein
MLNGRFTIGCNATTQVDSLPFGEKAPPKPLLDDPS